MKTISNITRKMCCAVAVGFLALAASSYAGPASYALHSYITTQDEVSALKPGDQVAMVCTKCHTVQIAIVDKGILGWFQPKTKHLCPGCGGHLVTTLVAGGKANSATFVHTCSKCGSDSAFCCGSGTEGMKGM